jgi:hypothetical protein
MTSPERDRTRVRLGFGQGRRLKSLITPNTPSVRSLRNHPDDLRDLAR